MTQTYIKLCISRFQTALFVDWFRFYFAIERRVRVKRVLEVVLKMSQYLCISALFDFYTHGESDKTSLKYFFQSKVLFIKFQNVCIFLCKHILILLNEP